VPFPEGGKAPRGCARFFNRRILGQTVAQCLEGLIQSFVGCLRQSGTDCVREHSLLFGF
jgi:hypothetical protein